MLTVPRIVILLKNNYRHTHRNSSLLSNSLVFKLHFHFCFFLYESACNIFFFIFSVCSLWRLFLKKNIFLFPLLFQLSVFQPHHLCISLFVIVFFYSCFYISIEVITFLVFIFIFLNRILLPDSRRKRKLSQLIRFLPFFC